jgi:L-asparaginase/Glu-tRNA(Gln) amidotransferase subunit D
MRPSDRAGAEGPADIMNAVRVAADAARAAAGRWC